METKRPKVKPSACKEAPEHPYEEYESHPFWKGINTGISNLVNNRDLIERAPRTYIVGYLCKMLLEAEK